MKKLDLCRFGIGVSVLLCSICLIPQKTKAQQTWNLSLGAESRDQAKQAEAFLPNEVWIRPGDSVTWTAQPKNEPHTVTFLTPGGIVPPPPPPEGPPPCPPPPGGVQPSGSSFTGASCVTSGPLTNGATYTVKFPTAGNYQLICLFHPDMSGVVHVVSTNPESPFYMATLPYIQGDYDKQARDNAADMIGDTDSPYEERSDFRHSQNVILMTGEESATAGGREQFSIVRFLPGKIVVHAGDTVEWINTDPAEPHTVTFGTEPGNPMARVNVKTDGDGALHGVIGSATDSVSSGFLLNTAENATGAPLPPQGLTRIRITFTHAGTYKYICALHDVSGMLGTVVVLP